jgi:L-fuconolactonase
MVIVDSHVHASNVWFEPIETLLFQMDRNKISKAVLIQHLGNFDNNYLLQCVKDNPGRFATVVLVDTKHSDAPEKLQYWASEGAVGIRLAANERSPEPDTLAIWRQANRLGLSVSCLGTIDMFINTDFSRIIETFPGLKIVLEHMGGLGPEIKNYGEFEKILALAKYPNVYIKMPGFGDLLPRPFPSKLPVFNGPPAAIKTVYDAFGCHRIMWASDFPPCMVKEGYANALYFPLETVPFFTEDDKDWIFGKTALSVWKILDV